MSDIRRAIFWASASQHLSLAINFAALLVLARLLTPAEYGISSLGLAILAIAEAIRELAGGSFLIRERELTPEKVRSTTTVSLLVTAAVSALLVLLADPLSSLFAVPMLAPYLVVSLLGYALGTFLYPQQALLGREMAFAYLAVAHMVPAVVGAFVSILLALIGFNALSLAWAGVASTATATVLCIAFRGDMSIYRPSLNQWRSVIAFGAYSSVTAVLSRIADAVPVLIFGRFLSAEALSLGHRAILLSQVPERLIQAAVGSVALPEFSRQAREGQDLKNAYLSALSYMAAVHWPIMITLALLAQPIVLVLLGHQWMEVAPLIRILSPALMLALPIWLQYAALVATDGVRLLPRLLLLQTLVLAAALWLATRYGLRAAALSALVAMPMNAALSILAVRSRIGFRWTELVAALSPSAVVSAATAAGPVVVVLASPSDMPLTIATAAAALGGAGWAVGLFVTGHPLWNELTRVAVAFLSLTFLRKLRSSNSIRS